jgi:GNAT superfamily N-acetyltransferase
MTRPDQRMDGMMIHASNGRCTASSASCGRLSPELTLALERIEGSVWEELYRAAPAGLREDHGLSTRRAACATLLLAPDLDILAFNRATGLGLEAPADRRAIGWIAEAFTAARVRRSFVPVAPIAEPSALASWLTSFGLRPYNRWEKLIRGVEDPPAVETRLRIEEVGADRTAEVGRIVAAGFDWPGWVGAWIAASVGRRGWIHYLAYDGETPIATAAQYHALPYGWLGWAATLPDHRGLGAQSALLSRRIVDARARGCTILTMETAENRPDRPSISNRNAIRAGFRVAYHRPNFIFETSVG